VRERCHELLGSIDLGLEPLTCDFVQMRGYRVTTHDPRGLQRRLHDEHRIEVPVIETRHGPVLRVSVQAYNDERDLEALSAALARTLGR
jgi:selenocysteine lyase/cysteine desulfurase